MDRQPIVLLPGHNKTQPEIAVFIIIIICFLPNRATVTRSSPAERSFLF